MKRVLCLWFPNWPIQRRRVKRPLIVYEVRRGKPHVIAASRSVRRRGVTPGMLLAEAQSFWAVHDPRAPRVEQHEPRADRQALRRLAAWCQRFTPTVAVDAVEQPDTLLLDATGCREDEFATDVLTTLRSRGLHALAAVADNAGTARAVAHFGVPVAGSRFRIILPGNSRKALAPLPIECLRLPPSVVPLLHELNVFKVEQLLVLPRAELPSRFGREILLAIDRTLGRLPELLVAEPPAEPLEACWDFEYPIPDGRLLEAVLGHLLDWLWERIDIGRLGVQSLSCTLRPVGNEPIALSVSLLRPSASKADLMERLRLRIEQLRLPAEVERVTLRVEVLRPLEFRQSEVFGGTDAGGWGPEVGTLLEQMSERLGAEAVLSALLRADAQPERAFELIAAIDTLVNPRPASRPPSGAGVGAAKPGLRPLTGAGSPVTGASRPLFLRRVPMRLTANPLTRLHHQPVDHFWGPERVETGWWRGGEVRRDYYVVQTENGERFWVYRDLNRRDWYLHGIFG